MTDIDMNAPLPQINASTSGVHLGTPRLELLVPMGHGGYCSMTLAHLVAVLRTLSPEQLAAVATHGLLEAPISDLAREELQLLRGAQERADRAETRVRELEKKDHNGRLELLNELHRAMGQLVADNCCDKQGQHYGIASCRELVLARIAPLVKS